MLDKRDITLLKGMFETYKKDTIREMRDELHSTVKAEGNAIRSEIAAFKSEVGLAFKKTEARIVLVEERIINSVAEIIDESVLSELNQHDRRITALELKTGTA